MTVILQHLNIGSILHRHVIVMVYEPRCEKTNVLGSNLVRHKPGCTTAEDG